MVQVEPAFEALIDHPSVIEKVRALFGDRFILHSSWNTMVPGTDATGKHPDPNPKTGFHQDGTGSYFVVQHDGTLKCLPGGRRS